jgi:flagellar basal-body rod protein FlgF
MDALYVALSAQVALEAKLDTIAQNVANLATAGYRADEIKFDAVMSKTAADSVAFASAGDTTISRKSGPLTRTDNQLDVAVQGDGWFALSTPAGTVYTRDGRMQLLETGDLVSLGGYRVLDAGLAPIQLDPAAGPPIIARDGMITQGGQHLGAIGLFRISGTAKLSRFENSGVIPNSGASAILDFTDNGMVQGFVEGSNVDPVSEMTKLIMVSRAFESASNMIETSESSLSDSIKTLGDTT